MQPKEPIAEFTYSLLTDEDTLEEFKSDPSSVVSKFDLSKEAKEAVLSGDESAIYSAMGKGSDVTNDKKGPTYHHGQQGFEPSEDSFSGRPDLLSRDVSGS